MNPPVYVIQFYAPNEKRWVDLVSRYETESAAKSAYKSLNRSASGTTLRLIKRTVIEEEITDV